MSAPGFVEKTVEVNFKFNGWYIGRMMIGGALGMLIVDPLTGAMWRIADPVVDEKLDSSQSSTLNIKNINDLSESDRKKLVKI